MKTISVLNQKGGVGKTTISVNLAAALSRKGKSVLLLDCDPQASALDWANARGEVEQLFPVVGCPKPTVHKVVGDIARDKDFVVIDGAPRVTDLSRSCIMASDLVLIPVQPSPYDIWASEEIVNLIKEAMIYKPGLQAAFVITRRIPNTAIGRDVASALETFELPILESTIAQRVIYAESASVGLSVQEQDKKSAAAQEVSALTQEVLSILEE